MPILYEDTFSRSDTTFFTAEEALPPPEFFTCPVCGDEFPTEKAMWEHVKTDHPWHWHFWYAPHGKPLLALTGVSVAGVVIVGLSKAFPPVPR